MIRLDFLHLHLHLLFHVLFAALARFEWKVGSISDLNLTAMKASLLVGNVSARNSVRVSKGLGMWRQKLAVVSMNMVMTLFFHVFSMFE